MKFKERLLQGYLVKRYKRFFADIKFKNKIITGHCPNPGSMMGLLNIGNKIWFSKFFTGTSVTLVPNWPKIELDGEFLSFSRYDIAFLSIPTA